MTQRKSTTVLIETPEHITLSFELAGIGKRALAYVIDKLLQLAFFFAMGICVFSAFLVAEFSGIGGGLNSEFGAFVARWGLALALLVYGIVIIGYFMLFEYWWNGVTPGKLSQEIKVISTDGRPITFVDCAVRNILRVVDILGDLYPLGLVCMFIDGKNRRLGDLAAGTLVVADRRSAGPVTHREPRTGPLGKDFSEIAIKMTADDYRIIAGFLSRRTTMDFHARRQLALDIHARLAAGRFNGPPDPPDAEEFLESCARSYRDRFGVL